MKLTDIRRYHVQEFLDDASTAGRGVVTVRRLATLLGTIFATAVKDELISANPARGVDRPSQFDSATGDENFLADTAHRNTMSYGFFDGENTLLTGNAKQLDDLVEDDVFRASVTVLGKMDYDTQIGGDTTVPLLEVNSLKVIG
jgi:hypothetical protein